MLKINGTEIDAEKFDTGDTRQKAFFNHEYVKTNPVIPDSALITPFKINGTPAPFAKKGYRPRFSGSTAYTGSVEVIHVLEKVTDKWRVVAQGIENGSLPEYVKYGVVHMIGGGGGGSGGSAALNGVGGGAGAFACFFLDMRNSTKFCVVAGTAGNGSSNRGQAGSGGATRIYVGEIPDEANLIVSCGGGGGGDGGDPGDGGTVTLGPRSDLIVMIHNSTGSNGYAGLSGTHTFNTITLSCGLEGETQCRKTYGPYSVGSNEAGGGANSFFGAGGSPGDSYGDNGNAPISTACGAGGGGGRMKPFGSTMGGSGMTGTFAIYY